MEHGIVASCAYSRATHDEILFFGRPFKRGDLFFCWYPEYCFSQPEEAGNVCELSTRWEKRSACCCRGAGSHHHQTFRAVFEDSFRCYHALCRSPFLMTLQKMDRLASGLRRSAGQASRTDVDVFSLLYASLSLLVPLDVYLTTRTVNMRDEECAQLSEPCLRLLILTNTWLVMPSRSFEHLYQTQQ